MPVKIGKTEQGDALHYAVGAIIKQYDKYLLIDRATPPAGFAILAAHLDEGEDIETAVKKVVDEESGLKVVNLKKLYEGEVKNLCSRGIIMHYWYMYECEVIGDPVLVASKAKSIGWYTLEEMKKLKFDPAVEYWFKKTKVL